MVYLQEYQPHKATAAVLSTLRGHDTGKGLPMHSNHTTRTPYFPANLDAYAPWVAKHGLIAPYGECQCGCGEDAPTATETAIKHGRVRGMPSRFRSGHNTRVQHPTPKKPIAERFWKYAGKRGADECWLWAGFIAPDGYGKLQIDGRSVGAHRISWELHNGPIPDGMNVLHQCDVRPCCNPSHLFLGTPADNNADKVAKGRQARGERQGLAKLNDVQVIEIREAYAAGVSSGVLSKQYGVNDATILCVVNRTTWKHIT